MNKRSLKGGRLALLAVAVVVVGMLFALPATAYAAKSSTRIVAVKTMTVNRNTPGINPWSTARLAVKLQKRISGTHYHAVSGTVKLYRWDPTLGDAGAYRYVAKKTGSSVSFSLPGRGKYKLTYAGSSTTKASTAYTGVYETIGATVGTPVYEYASVLGTTTQTWVTVKYPLSWNTEALDGPLVLTCAAQFEDAAAENFSPWFYFERQCRAPFMAEFTYKVENADKLENIHTWGGTYVEEWFRGNYVKTPADLENVTAVP